jgi:hypothetical protein
LRSKIAIAIRRRAILRRYLYYYRGPATPVDI